MKKIAFLFFLFFSLNSFSQTQLETDEEAYNNYYKADRELNTIYQQILKEYKSDAEFIKNFKKFLCNTNIYFSHENITITVAE